MTQYYTRPDGNIDAYEIYNKMVITLIVEPEEGEEINDVQIHYDQTFSTLKEFFIFIAEHIDDLEEAINSGHNVELTIKPIEPKIRAYTEVYEFNNRIKGKIQLDISDFNELTKELSTRLELINQISNLNTPILER